MTQVDFYVLQQEEAIVRLHYACRLAEKALHHGHHIVIAVDNESQASTLSDYLWSFKPESFLPHQLQHEEPQRSDTPIQVMWDQDRDEHHDILINLSEKIPEGFSRFKRVMEIVVQEKTCLTLTRAHFQFYRDRGYPLKSHSIEGQ